MGRAAAIFVTLTACASPPASAPSNAVSRASEPAAPDLAALQQRLHAQGAHHFDADAVDRGCPATDPLGTYVAMLVQQGTHGDAPGDTHELTGGCGPFPAKRIPLDPAPDPAYWYCLVSARIEDPRADWAWHYDLRLRMRKADGAIDTGSFGCFGMP